jgi:2-polyprenyl-6-methoxyphenol hydroxylase-like FAD-dependent oxidoreductase
MGLLRRWGLADAVRDASPLPPDFPSDIAFVTRVLGWELTRFPNAMSTTVDRSRPFPEPAQQIPQYVMEDLMREYAEGLPGVSVSLGTILESFEQSDTGVTATVKDIASGETTQINAKFLVGADGAASTVRQQLGIENPGDDLAPNVSAVLRAPDLWAINDKAPCVHYWTTTPDAPGIVGPLDPTELWWFHLNEADNNGSLTDEELKQKFYAAVGSDDFECEVVANGPWTAEARLADKYRVGRVFLAGDAAHLHPPMGGYGMNMGIGDALDLGWKFAAVINGWGGEELLESYELERRPIAQRVIEEAVSNYKNNSNRYKAEELEEEGPEADALREEIGELIHDEKAKEFATLGVQLGYRYDASPVIVPDGTPATPNEVSVYVPTARPGHLAPHAWIDDDTCIYDLLGKGGLTLLRLTKKTEQSEALIAAAADVDVPLTVVDLIQPEIRELYGADLAIVRPDQHVAWRGNSGGDATKILDQIRGSSTVTSRNACVSTS